MKIFELFDKTPAGYGTDEDDKTSLKLSDLRKTRLTLGQLNKLRIMNDVKKLEHEQKLLKIKSQYRVSSGGSGEALSL
ncbi:MAG: hypothetical protein N2235_16610 [Fischerella sp.]|nr:hypothetical protein [Fischerella sp.]